MGYRTIVVLYNDEAHTWENDPELGKKISRIAACRYPDGIKGQQHLEYGKVVQHAHADCQTLVVFDSYNMIPLAEGNWNAAETNEDIQLKLLKDAASKLGYRLVKKPVVK